MMTGQPELQRGRGKKSFVLLSVGIVGYLGILRVFQPLFTDEITYFLMANRYIAEGYDLWRFMPDCSPRPLTVGWILYPFYVIRSLIATVAHSPYWLIVYSYVQALSFVGICYCLSAVGVTGERPWNRLIRLAPLGLGAFPAYLLLGRPEMSALLLIGLQLLLVASEKSPLTRWEIRPVVAVLLAGVLCSHHPQMIVFLPLFLVSAWWRRSPVVSILCIVSICVIGAQTLQVGTAIRSCPDRPVIEQLLARATLQTEGIWHHPLGTVGAFIQNIGNSLVLLHALAVNELTEVAFPYVYTFPSATVGSIGQAAVVVFGILLILGVIIGVVAIGASLFRRQGITRREFLLLTLLLCLFLWAGMRGPKMWYLVVLLYGIVVLIWIQLFPRHTHRPSVATVRRFVDRCGVGLMSVSCVLNLYSLVGDSHTSVRGSSVPTAVFPLDISSLTKDMQDLMQRCGFPTDRSRMTLVTDDFSSLALWDVAHQLHGTYYTVWAPDIKERVAFLAGMGAWGFLGMCEGYEALYGATPVRIGALCCQPYGGNPSEEAR